jgi:hypothetical protein
MTLNVEWRVLDGNDAIAVIDGGRVTEVAIPDAALIKDYLAVTSDLDQWRKWPVWHATGLEERSPEAWGDLVMDRSDTGDVLSIDPELFWERVYHWFRSRGIDYNT